MDRNLSCFCFEDFTLQSYDIADIHLFEQLVSFFTDAVPCHIALDRSVQILNMAKGRFAHHTLGHDTSCNGNRLSFEGVKVFCHVCTVMCDIIFRNPERIVAAFLQFLEFVSSDLQQAVQILLRLAAVLVF